VVLTQMELAADDAVARDHVAVAVRDDRAAPGPCRGSGRGTRDARGARRAWQHRVVGGDAEIGVGEAGGNALEIDELDEILDRELGVERGELVLPLNEREAIGGAGAASGRRARVRARRAGGGRRACRRARRPARVASKPWLNARRRMVIDRRTHRPAQLLPCGSTSGTRRAAGRLARWRDPDLGLRVRVDDPPGHVAIEYLDRHRGHHGRIE